MPRHDDPESQRLFDEAPVYYIGKFGGWAISRSAEGWTALEDAEIFGTTRGSTAALSKVEPPVPSIN